MVVEGRTKAAGSVPLTIISGFLGAGKTTIINRLVQKNEHVRTGLLVNDFAELNIDAQLIRNKIKQQRGENGDEEEGEGDEGSLIELSNGCVCCSLSGELQHSIQKVLELGVEHIIVETSGVSDPKNIVDTLLLPQVISLVWLSGIVVVVDGESIYTTLERNLASRSQLQEADVVILNKTDLLTNDEYEKVKELIREAAPDQFNIIPSQYGNIPSSVIFGFGEGRRPKGEERASMSSSSSTPHDLWKQLGSSTGDHPAKHEDELEGFMTMSYSRKGATFDLARFQSFMAHQFPPQIVRAKGFLYFDCAPELCYTLQLSGKRRFDAVSQDKTESEHHIGFVFIGSNFDKQSLTCDLDKCLSRAGSDPVEKEPPKEGCAEALCAIMEKDIRFLVDKRDGNDKLKFPNLVFFQLKPTRWHGMSAADMNRSLLSKINSQSSVPPRIFLTHVIAKQCSVVGSGGVGGARREREKDSSTDFLLRLDTTGKTSADELWQAIQRATESLLTNVFMNTYCCGIK